ncbi:MAG TPA: transcription antitermination factor NusB, partial [Chthoniobacterales bacterium]
MSSRQLALAALRRWRTSTDFADQIIGESLGQSALSASDRGFALELFYGILRNLTLLDFCIAQLRSEPVDPNSRDVLRLGLYQLLLLETAEHAAVFETVELAAKRARPLVNAILRRAAREKIRLTNSIAAQPLPIQFSEPEFLIAKWNKQFGLDATTELCRWNNQPAPVYARSNSLKISSAQFLQKYPKSNPLPTRPQFVRPNETAAALADGHCYIQDPSTVLACELLDPQPNDFVLDACAAPGGKSAYLAELMGNVGRLVVVDRDPVRLERLQENLVRLGVANAE